MNGTAAFEEHVYDTLNRLTSVKEVNVNVASYRYARISLNGPDEPITLVASMDLLAAPASRKMPTEFPYPYFNCLVAATGAT